MSCFATTPVKASFKFCRTLIGMRMLRVVCIGSDLEFLQRAAIVAKSSEGLYQPHPYYGCVLVSQEGKIISETHHKAEGTATAESQAISEVKSASRGSTAYLNMELGHVSSVHALIHGGIERVVIGTENPLSHLRSKFIQDLQEQGITVSLLTESPHFSSELESSSVLHDCLLSNEALWHLVATNKPLSILKYAMTMDGKIAASTGHSAWVSSSTARKEVFATRAKSNAVIVGGNTVRRDNPNLTTRMERGFAPTRIVMSRTLDLPIEANLWNVQLASTIVMTQRGARRKFQDQLRSKGVEVVEFDFLTPSNVVNYCQQRGFLQLLWECGGTLAAPALASGAIHKIMAFVAPKIIGGEAAPTPCGDLGFVEMTQAVEITDMKFLQVGPDIMLTGYSPASGGLLSLYKKVTNHSSKWLEDSSLDLEPRASSKKTVVEFYKTWNEWGDLSNFTLYPIRMWNTAGPHGHLPTSEDTDLSSVWQSIEHYYQSQKFINDNHPESKEIQNLISEADSAEEAAKIGRTYARSHPHLIRPDWSEVKLEIMREALLAKFTTHKAARDLLLSTNSFSDSIIVERAPGDSFWGIGFDQKGDNHLGKLLMMVRDELQRSSLVTSNQNSSLSV